MDRPIRILRVGTFDVDGKPVGWRFDCEPEDVYGQSDAGEVLVGGRTIAQLRAISAGTHMPMSRRMLDDLAGKVLAKASVSRTVDAMRLVLRFTDGIYVAVTCSKSRRKELSVNLIWGGATVGMANIDHLYTEEGEELESLSPTQALFG